MGRPPDTTRLASLRSARDLIDRDFATAVDVTALAAQAGYSRYHFIRAFRAAYGAAGGHPASDSTWARARGWALALSLVFLAHSADNPLLAGVGRRTIDAVLA